MAHSALHLRDLPLILLDAGLVVAAYGSMLMLRFDGLVPSGYWDRFGGFILMAIVVHLSANWAWRLYGQIWRHASIKEARLVVLSGATAAAALLGVTVVDQSWMPRSVVVPGSAMAVMVMGALRFQSRLFSVRRGESHPAGLRVVVIGAGEAGAMIVREMQRDPGAGLRPVAVLDDDVRKQGRQVHGLPVLGRVESLPDFVEQFQVHQAVLAVADPPPALVRRSAAAAAKAGVPIKVLGSLRHRVRGSVSMRDVRDLRIEDLLGRQQVRIDLDAVRQTLCGRRVLVTGAGGSIGAEIARQVAACEPAALILLDHDETHLHDAASELPGQTAVQVLADIRDGDRLAQVFARHRPEIVFHAAAHKHVPILEEFASEAVTTNVVGTLNVVRAAADIGVERLVFISTDKAVRPESVMGASKWLGEQIVLDHAPPGRPYCAVRFGNVLGSRGSVIPTFTRQIAAGGPVTVTDDRMTRFFMSIPEAVQLVLQASAFAEGGDVFMLDMGAPVKILDLARRMIRLSGLEEGVDISIEITGKRAGEKLEEQLRAPGEAASPTPHPSILRLRPVKLPSSTLEGGLARLRTAAAHHRDGEAASLLLSLSDERELPGVVIDLHPPQPVVDLREPLVDPALPASSSA